MGKIVLLYADCGHGTMSLPRVQIPGQSPSLPARPEKGCLTIAVRL